MADRRPDKQEPSRPQHGYTTRPRSDFGKQVAGRLADLQEKLDQRAERSELFPLPEEPADTPPAARAAPSEDPESAASDPVAPSRERVDDLPEELPTPGPDASLAAIGAATVSLERRRQEIERELVQQRALARAEAGRLLADARDEAEMILREAREEANRILRQAQATADGLLALAASSYERRQSQIRDLDSRYETLVAEVRRTLEAQLAGLPEARPLADETPEPAADSAVTFRLPDHYSRSF